MVHSNSAATDGHAVHLFNRGRRIAACVERDEAKPARSTFIVGHHANIIDPNIFGFERLTEIVFRCLPGQITNENLLCQNTSLCFSRFFVPCRLNALEFADDQPQFARSGVILQFGQ
jgi:hypothetical protein